MAINSMIHNINEIYEITESKGEYFFKYKEYIWSVYGLDDEVVLTYFPYCRKIDDAISKVNYEREYSNIRYKSGDFKSVEDIESFNELYRKIKERVYNVDKVLDDIIGDI